MEYNFKNKIVVVTGGGSGIGFSVAKAFAGSGALICILGRSKEKLLVAQKQVKLLGKCEIFSTDVSKSVSLEKVFKNIVKKYRKIDILVNCAGVYGPIGKFHTNELNAWHEAISVNLLGTVNASHAVLPFMVKEKQGKIVNLSGGGAVQPFPNFSSYAVSKAAIVRFTENLAKEYEKENVQVNAIAPGAINTSFLELVLKAGKEKVGKEFYEKSLLQKQTGGDSPELAAELVLFLCSEKCSNLTGKLISAKWDPWKKWTVKDLKKILKNSEYTLRRIDNKYFYEK